MGVQGLVGVESQTHPRLCQGQKGQWEPSSVSWPRGRHGKFIMGLGRAVKVLVPGYLSFFPEENGVTSPKATVCAQSLAPLR